MLILPIKKKWFDMIASGEKKEEYREIKPYYTTRFTKALGLSGKNEREDVMNIIAQTQVPKLIKVMFRNGYSKESLTLIADCKLSVGNGKEEWGAEPGETYYVLTIEEMKGVENSVCKIRNPVCKEGYPVG